MRLEEIESLPVAQLAAEDAHLHLWTTHSFLFEAQRVMRAWGFEYKSIFVWTKPSPGTGYYWRSAAEFLLLGVRGQCPFLDHSIITWICVGRGQHSEKPERIRTLIEAVSPHPISSSSAGGSPRAGLCGATRSPGAFSTMTSQPSSSQSIRPAGQPETATMKFDEDVIRRCAEQIVELVRNLPPEDIDRIAEAIVPVIVNVVRLHQPECWKARRKLGSCECPSPRSAQSLRPRSAR
jgi:hypothetical protein